MPTLAGLALFAALLDLFLRRGAMRIFGEGLAHASRLMLAPHLRIVLNVLAISAAIATFDAVHQIVRTREAGTLARRGSLAMILVPFVACISIATFMRAEHTTYLLVLLGAMLGHVLGAQLSLGTIEHRAEPLIRIVGLAMLATTLGSVVSIVLSVLAPGLRWSSSYAIEANARDVAEIAWCLSPPLTLAALVVRDPRRLRSPRLRAAALVFILATLAVVRVRAYLGADYTDVLYGALRLLTFAEGSALPYACVIGCALAALVHGRLSGDGVDRMLAYGAGLLLAAGVAPRAMSELVSLVLAAALFARALFASAKTRT